MNSRRVAALLRKQAEIALELAAEFESADAAAAANDDAAPPRARRLPAKPTPESDAIADRISKRKGLYPPRACQK